MALRAREDRFRPIFSVVQMGELGERASQVRLGDRPSQTLRPEARIRGGFRTRTSHPCGRSSHLPVAKPSAQSQVGQAPFVVIRRGAGKCRLRYVRDGG